MPTFTPVSGGASFAFDGVVFTEESAVAGFFEISLQLTLGGVNISDFTPMSVALIGDEQFDLQPHGDLHFFNDSPTELWDMHPSGASYPTRITTLADDNGYLLLPIHNATTDSITCRLAVVLPSGALTVSGEFVVQGQPAP